MDWGFRTAGTDALQSWRHVCSRGGTFRPLALLEAAGVSGLMSTASRPCSAFTRLLLWLSLRLSSVSLMRTLVPGFGPPT